MRTRNPFNSSTVARICDELELAFSTFILSADERASLQRHLSQHEIPICLTERARDEPRRYEKQCYSAATALLAASEAIKGLDRDVFNYLEHGARLELYQPHVEVVDETSAFESEAIFLRRPPTEYVSGTWGKIEVGELVSLLDDLAGILAVGAGRKLTIRNVPFAMNNWMRVVSSVWEDSTGREFTRSFEKSEPINPCSLFAVLVCREVDSKVPNTQVETAMKSLIKSEKRRPGKKRLR